MKSTWLLLLGTVAVTPALWAQERGRPWRLWGAAGIGPASTADAALAVVAEVAVQKAPHYFAAHGVLVAEIGGRGCEKRHLGVLYGRTVTGVLGHAAIATGLAATNTDVNCSRSGLMPGVPIVGEVALRVLPVLGIGFQSFANVNPREPFWGIVLFVQLGWLPR
jgi:hypothetical protein